MVASARSTIARCSASSSAGGAKAALRARASSAVKRSVGKSLVERLAKKGKASASVKVDLAPVSSTAFNVVGRIAAEPADGKKLPGVVVIGAHYDHLGM